MAVCTVAMDKNNSFLPPAHNNEKKKLFSNLTSRKMFGRFLANSNNNNNSKEKPKDSESCVQLCTKTQNYETDRRRPLVINKENTFNIDNHQRMNSRSPTTTTTTTARRSQNLNNEITRTCRDDEVPRNRRTDSPPRLITVSGKLSSERIRDVIKPIAYKPPTYARMTSSHDCLPIHASDEGYNSQNMSSSSAATSSSSSSNTSTNFQSDRPSDLEANHVRQIRYLRPRPKSSTISCSKRSQCDDVPLKDCGRMSEFQVDECTTNLGTFQPAIIVQGYHHPTLQRSMEEQLNGREVVRDMRSRLEINERVMTSVLQTKEREWKKDVEDREERWRDKMKWHHEKSFRNEQGLLIEVMELRRENNHLMDRLNDSEKDKHTAVNEKNEAQKFVRQLKSHLEESHWQTTRKLNEIVSLRSSHQPIGKLKTAFSSQNVPDGSLASSPVYEQVHETVKGQLFQSSRRRSLGGKLNPVKTGRDDDTKEYFTNQVDDDIVGQMEDMRKQNELEHYVWMCEKSKVIDYQKKLQCSYLDVCQKNQSLQEEVIRLRRKLEMNSLDCIETESFC